MRPTCGVQLLAYTRNLGFWGVWYNLHAPFGGGFFMEDWWSCRGGLREGEVGVRCVLLLCVGRGDMQGTVPWWRTMVYWRKAYSPLKQTVKHLKRRGFSDDFPTVRFREGSRCLFWKVICKMNWPDVPAGWPLFHDFFGSFSLDHLANGLSFERLTIYIYLVLLIEEILHQLIGSFSYYLQGFIQTVGQIK